MTDLATSGSAFSMARKIDSCARFFIKWNQYLTVSRELSDYIFVVVLYHNSKLVIGDKSFLLKFETQATMVYLIVDF